MTDQNKHREALEQIYRTIRSRPLASMPVIRHDHLEVIDEDVIDAEFVVVECVVVSKEQLEVPKINKNKVTTRRWENTQGSSNKFWEMDIEELESGFSHYRRVRWRTRWGRIGTGKPQETPWREGLYHGAHMVICRKLKDGYIPVGYPTKPESEEAKAKEQIKKQTNHSLYLG